MFFMNCQKGNRGLVRCRYVAPCKGIGIPESVRFLLLESRIRETFACGIRNPGLQLKESRILLTTGIQNPSASDKYCNQEPGIRNPRCEIQNPRLSWIPLHGARYETDEYTKRHLESLHTSCTSCYLVYRKC